MTMMPVEKPAISPYGHVMGYDSWVKLLNRNPKNTCPFTKKVGGIFGMSEVEVDAKIVGETDI